MEQVDLKGIGDLGYVVNELGRFSYLRAEDGSWVKRPDVFLNDAYLGKGQSAPHSVDACGPTFGPELGLGFVMGTFPTSRCSSSKPAKATAVSAGTACRRAPRATPTKARFIPVTASD